MHKMKSILITGATGTIGVETIRGLRKIDTKHRIIAGVYHPENSRASLAPYKVNEIRKLDFTDPSTFHAALKDVDIVLLLRPPQLADVPKYFEPFLEAMSDLQVNQIVFLSVQGVENQKSIPHHKIEKLIQHKRLKFVFLRPSYFMQNLTTTLIHEIRAKGEIFIPAGSLEFTWVDARDIGLVGAHTLNCFDKYENQSFVITGSECKGFKEVAAMLSSITSRQITYTSPNLVKFFREKRKLGMQKMMIFVMIMLHYLPRFSKKKAELFDTVKQITGHDPGSLEAFIRRERTSFLP